MAKDRLSDTLAVILHADVEGSTELVHQDKQLAHERIQDSFRRFSNTIEKYHGQVLELRGDALLASFERSFDAVAAALAFQADHSYQISRLQDDLRPLIRVGISMGEIVIADNTVTGTGVVQAQRVEQLAGPGGVCITAVIHDSLSKRMPFEFVSLGEKELKGFDHAVHVYRVELAPGESVPVPTEAGKQNAPPGNRGLIAAFVAVILVVVGGTAFWFKSQEPKVEAASIERMAFPLPDKPSIAVLPFTNMSNDTEQEYFVDGLTEDLITDISKISGLFVVARNSVFTYKGQVVKVRQVAEELGVRYVMEGSVRRAGNTVRINVQLIDALSGDHVWAEKYDGDMDDIFRLQDDIVAKIIYSLNQKIIPQKTIAETDVPEAYDLFLQGMKHYYLSDSDSVVKAIGFFKQAIELDSNYYRAYGQLAAAYQWILTLNWESKLGMKRDQVKGLVKESLNIALKEPTSAAYRASAWMKFYNGHYSAAIEEIDKAIALNPNDPYNFSDKAHMQVTTGPTKEIEENALRAIRLNPNVAGGHLRALGRGLFHQNRFLEAANAFERAQKLEPDFEVGYMILAAIYGNLGEVQKANAALKKYEKFRADSGHRPRTLLKIRNARKWVEESHLERLLRGLRNAGMPEN